MATTLGGARKLRDAALAAVAGLFLLGALAGGGRRTSTENLMSVAYGLLPISERVSFSQAAAQCPTTETVRAGVWAAVCPTGDELMWCSRRQFDFLTGSRGAPHLTRAHATRQWMQNFHLRGHPPS